MEPRLSPVRKHNRGRRLFTVRSALIFQLALLTGLGGAGLLLAAHRATALAVLGGLGIFALSLTFYNDLIE